MKRSISAAAAILLLGGCTWWGFEPASTYQATQVQGCPGIGTQNLNDTDRPIIIEAAAVACRTIRSAEFERHLKGLQLREACDSDVRIAGVDALDVVRTDLPDHSIIARKPWLAEALTDPQSRRIAIRKKRFEAWKRGGAGRGALVNTLVHEWTHLILDDGGSVRFRDRGHTGESPGCPQTELVSYRLGNLAEEIWRSDAGLN